MRAEIKVSIFPPAINVRTAEETSSFCETGASVLHYLVNSAFIPIFIIGCVRLYNTGTRMNGNTWLGIMLGIVSGVTLHELSHAATAVHCGGVVTGWGIKYTFFPCAYVQLAVPPSRRCRTAIFGAGIKMNLLLVGAFFCLYSVRRSAVMFYAGIGNLWLALLNICCFYSLDGYMLLCCLLGEEDLLKKAFIYVFCRRQLKRSPDAKTYIISLIILAFQVMLPVVMVLILLASALEK